MKVIKPVNLSVGYRNFTIGSDDYMCITIHIGFSLSTSEFVDEQKMWKTIGSKPTQIFDSFFPKTRGEFIIRGAFFPTLDDKSEGNGTVKATLWPQGDNTKPIVDKRLIVHQHRKWGDTIAGVRPVRIDRGNNESIELDYQNAFGGKNFPSNPDGKGLNDDLLPCVEYHDQLVASKSDRPKPASYGPIPQFAEPRSKFVGTIDDEYLQFSGRGFPKDFSLKYFDEVPDDQAIEGYFQGGETFELQGMTEKKRSLTGIVPTYVGRVFIERSIELGQENANKYEEVETVFDTLWLVPNEDLGVCSYRCIVPDVGTGYGSKSPRLSAVLAAFEDKKDEPRKPEHYFEEFRKRTSSEERYKHLLNGLPLVPMGMKNPIEQLVDDSESSVQNYMLEHSKKLIDEQKILADTAQTEAFDEAKAILNANEVLVDKIEGANALADVESSSPGSESAIIGLINRISPGLAEGKKLDLAALDLSALDELQEKLSGEADKAKAEALERANQQLQTFESFPPGLEKEKGLKAARSTIEALTLPRPWARLEIKEHIEKFRAPLEQMTDEQIAGNRELVSAIDQAEEAISQAEDGFRKGHLLSAHTMMPARSPHPGKEGKLRESLLKNYALREKISGNDFACIDLSGLDLSGIDLSHCFLEGVNFSKCILKDVNFSQSILTTASFSGASIEDADFSDANLGGCDFTATNSKATNFSRVILSGANLVDSEFDRCEFGRVLLTKDHIDRARIIHSKFSQSIFHDCLFTDCDFTGTEIPKSVFVKSELRNHVFDSANLDSTSFLECHIEGYSCNNVSHINTRYFHGTSITRATYENCHMDTSSFRGAKISDSSFRECRLNKSDFCEAALVNSEFNLCHLRGASFLDSKLRGVRFLMSDLMTCSLVNADLFGADFSGSSLFGADFLQANMGENRFENSNLDASILKEWQPKR